MAEIRDPQTYAIIGAATPAQHHRCSVEIHKQLGHGFLEAVYQEAAVVEFPLHKIPFAREVLLPVYYREKLIAQYRADFVCFSEVIVEFKAQSQLTGVDEAQVLNYLKATGFQRALLINFGARSLEYKRLIFSQNKQKSAPSAKSAD
jgi:GxxExxY protein